MFNIFVGVRCDDKEECQESLTQARVLVNFLLIQMTLTEPFVLNIYTSYLIKGLLNATHPIYSDTDSSSTFVDKTVQYSKIINFSDILREIIIYMKLIIGAKH